MPTFTTDTIAAAADFVNEHIESLPPKDRGFADNLLRALDKWGSLTERQAPWLVKFANRLAGHDDTPARPSADGVDGAALIAHFDRAAQHLKFPKVKLTAGGAPLVFGRAGGRAKHPGSVNLTDGGPYGDNVWYGRVLRDGTVEPSAKCTPEVLAVVKAFAADPARVAAAYGQRTGCCCFCSRELSDERSVSVGYGPICADHHGLPWGG